MIRIIIITIIMTNIPTTKRTLAKVVHDTYCGPRYVRGIWSDIQCSNFVSCLTFTLQTFVSYNRFCFSMLTWDMKEVESENISFGTRPLTLGTHQPVTT